VARHTVSQPEKLVEEVVLGPGPKTGRNLAALRTGAGKMDDFEVWFAELNELPEINNIIQYPSGHIRRISTKFS
jgi:hypothetical protein